MKRVQSRKLTPAEQQLAANPLVRQGFTYLYNGLDVEKSPPSLTEGVDTVPLGRRVLTEFIEGLSEKNAKAPAKAAKLKRAKVATKKSL